MTDCLPSTGSEMTDNHTQHTQQAVLVKSCLKMYSIIFSMVSHLQGLK